MEFDPLSDTMCPGGLANVGVIGAVVMESPRLGRLQLGQPSQGLHQRACIAFGRQKLPGVHDGEMAELRRFDAIEIPRIVTVGDRVDFFCHAGA